MREITKEKLAYSALVKQAVNLHWFQENEIRDKWQRRARAVADNNRNLKAWADYNARTK